MQDPRRHIIHYLSIERGLNLAQRPDGVVAVLDLLLEVGLLHGELLLRDVGVVERLREVVQAVARVAHLRLQGLVRLLYVRLKEGVNEISLLSWGTLGTVRKWPRDANFVKCISHSSAAGILA